MCIYIKGISVYLIIISMFIGTVLSGINLKSSSDRSIEKNIVSKKYSMAGAYNNLLDNLETATKSDTKKVPVSDTKQNNKKRTEKIFQIFNTSRVFQTSQTLLISMIFAWVFSKNKFHIKHKVPIKKPPDIFCYKNRILKFISPVEKYIKVLAQKYDLNPIFIVFGEHSTRIFNKSVFDAGFLFVK